jgi:DNA-binding response OmpR family regulator
MDRALKDRRLDLVVLDIMLPGEDGLSICRRLRASSKIPIIMLTAKGEDIDRIVGLEIKADDYLTKPFNPSELLARIRAVLRRGIADLVESARFCRVRKNQTLNICAALRPEGHLTVWPGFGGQPQRGPIFELNGARGAEGCPRTRQ